MKDRMQEVSAVRVIATLGIVIYHASLILNNDTQAAPSEFFNKMAISAWGNIFVTVFFALSGFCIIYNNGELTNLWKYYKKRIVCIFVSYYLVWFLVFIKRAIVAKNFFYNGKTLSIVLSLFGLDGYMGGRYYAIGEWFLGALLICYLIYPLLLKGYKLNVWVSSIVILIFYNVGLHYQIGHWDISFRGIFTCILSFWIGMIMNGYRKKIVNNILFLICAIDVFWHLYTYKVTSLDVTTWSVFTGITCFIILLFLGKFMANWNYYKCIEFLSSISFQMFLLHHLIIYKCAALLQQFGIEASGVTKWIVFSVILLIIVVFSYFLKIINDRIVLCIKRKEK